VAGSGERAQGRSLGSVRSPQSKSVCNPFSYRSFAGQNSIDLSALNAMASRKSSLTALSLNCRSQEPDNIIIVKDNGLPADVTSKGYFGLAFHCRRHGTRSAFQLALKINKQK
jgi:hypothetical protein